MKRFFGTLWFSFVNLLSRIYDLIIKLISVKGIVLGAMFYLTLAQGSDIWAFIVVASWIVGVRELSKAPSSSSLGLTKDTIMNWVDSIKNRFISKADEPKEEEEQPIND